MSPSPKNVRKSNPPADGLGFSHAAFSGRRIIADSLYEIERHDDIELNLATRGRALLEVSGDLVLLPVDQLTIHWAGRAHRIIAKDTDAEVLQITVPFAWLVAWNLPEVLTSLLLNGTVFQEPAQRREDREHMEVWRAGAASQKADLQVAGICEVQARLLRLWARRPATILRRGESRKSGVTEESQPAAPATRVERAIRCINSNFRHRLTVEAIAAAACVHPNYLASLFHKHIGSSPADFLAMQRVRHAQRLLATTQRKAIDIAFECGFPSSSRFYAAFAKFCGKTPGDYRRMLPHTIALAGPGHQTGSEPPQAPVESAQRAPASRALSHLLWVDDQPLNNLDERRMLAGRGFVSDSYTCNRDALEALRTYSYALVISDLARVGGRETGWDLLREVRVRHPDLPLLFFTDRVTPALAKRAQKAGAQGIHDRTAELVAAVMLHAPTPAPLSDGQVNSV